MLRSRRLLHGLLAGVLLSCMRAPLGLDWTQLVVVQASTAALFRAAALLGLALSLDARRPAFAGGVGGGWPAALLLGFALHGLVLDAAPGSRAGFALTLVVATVALRALAGAPRPAEGEAPGPDPLSPLERVGLVLTGIGAAWALETVAREAGRLTMATTADATAVGVTLLGVVALGTVGFGPLLARVRHERLRSAPVLALAAGLTIAGLYFLSGMQQDGLHAYLRRFDPTFDVLRALDTRLGGALGLASLPTLDGASIGTLWTTLVLAGGALVLPGFAVGAVLGAESDARRVQHALLGASVGLVLLPVIASTHGRPLGPDELAGASHSWDLIALGAFTAGVGAALACFTMGAGRGIALALALVAVLLPWARARLPVLNYSPWSPVLIVPDLAWHTPEGLLTVERTRDGSRVLTLERRRLTPIAIEKAADEQRLRQAWSLLPQETRTRAVRALFVGQLTPERARVLGTLGRVELDRTAPWHAAMPAVEELLFEGGEAPPGRVVTPASARSTLRDGGYDWVVCLPVSGPIVAWKSEAREKWGAADGPRFTDLGLADETVGVAWFAGDALWARGTVLEPVVLHLDTLETLTVGLLRGPARTEGRDVGERFSVELEPPSPWTFLTTMPQRRKFLLDRHFARSIDPATAPDLVAGLVVHFDAQDLSSPYESRAQQIELEEDALRAFLRAAGTKEELDPFTAALWESLAWAITEKRMPEQALVYLEPVAEHFGPWPYLDRAVARAYREVLEPELALQLLRRALQSLPDDRSLLLEAADAALEAGDPGAEELVQRLLELAPREPAIARELGLMLFRAEDTRATTLLERALSANPGDDEVRRALGLPPVEGDGHDH